MPIPSYVFIRRTPVLAAALGVVLLQAPAPSALYTPRSVALAYKHGTRSPDGKPGPRYWQNHGRYAITVTAAPPDRTVRGLSLIHISEPTRLLSISYAVFCLKKKKHAL